MGSFAEAAWLEPVEVASKDRLILPAAVRKRLGWGRATGTVQLLAVMAADGGLELLPWEPRGREEIERVRGALEEASEEERGDLILAAMDRYALLGLTPDGRLRLPAPLAAHLDASGAGSVRVAASGGRLWLWSERAWEATRRSRFARLDEALTSARQKQAASSRARSSGARAESKR